MRVLLFILIFGTLNACTQTKNPESNQDTNVQDSSEKPGPSQTSSTLNYIQIQAGQLPELMQPGSRLMPLISAHRGGRNMAGYPENSIEAFQYIADSIPAMIECDISMSSDGILLMMHDNTLDRTTNGTGKVTEKTWAEMENLKLIDDYGTQTDFGIPLLEEVLAWAKGKAILSLDVKRGVPFKNVIDLVEEMEMEDYTVIITYNVNDALAVNRMNKDLMISVSIRNDEEWQRMKTSGLPFDRMVAFTGTRLSPKGLYETLHAENIPTILGTLGNLDKQAAAQGDSLTYTRFLELGIDILATDRPLEAGSVTENY
ncbi:MAG: glycerophosphodiester phosphodiesterase family protein [Saprospiraceae bacterium]